MGIGFFLTNRDGKVREKSERIRVHVEHKLTAFTLTLKLNIGELVQFTFTFTKNERVAISLIYDIYHSFYDTNEQYHLNDTTGVLASFTVYGILR